MDIDDPATASSNGSALRPRDTSKGHGDIDAELDIFDETTNLEARFFQEGYDDGFAHGRLHGLFEGRALGQEKAWEIWEEVGFYEGFAGMWGALLPLPAASGLGGVGVEEVGRKSKEARSAQHVRQLLDLIASFPTTNPAPHPGPEHDQDQVISSNATAETPVISAGSGSDATDLPRLLSAIRAKYRLLCTSLGVRPRLVAAPAVEGAYDTSTPGEGVEGGTIVNLAAAKGGGVGVVQGIEGPMKGVDTRQLRF